MKNIKNISYYDIFTPGSPPVYNDLLIGREEESTKLISLLNSSGQHPFILGPRGIGKTSLVTNTLIQDFIQIEINTVSNFNEFCFAVLNELGLNINIIINTFENDQNIKVGGKFFVEGSVEKSNKTTYSERGLGDFKFNSYLLESFMKKIPEKKIIFIDEVDTLSDTSDIKSNLVSFIKAISNKSKSFPHKFIFAGIGKDIHSIFGNHLSVSRNIIPIYLKPLQQNDILLFLRNAEKHLNIEILEGVKKMIAVESLGQPYYVQQVGYYMLDEFINDKDSRKITVEHFLKGKERAFEAAFSSLLFKYKFTFYKLNIYEKEILKTLIRLYRPSRQDEVIQHLHSISNLEVKHLFEALESLKQKEYIVLRQADKTLLFKEPLLLPFLKTKLGEKGTNSNQLPLNFQ